MTKSESRSSYNQVHQALNSYVETRAVPGFAALIDDGREVHIHCGGHLAFESSAPVQRDTIFRISSMTKPIVATAALMLVQDGTIKLEDSVERWLPELANRRVLKGIDAPIDITEPAGRAITLKDLLTFCMGFGLVMAYPGTYPIQDAIAERKIGDGPPQPQLLPPADEWMRRISKLPLMCQPGSKWLYDTAYNVLGVLIARVSGQSLELFLEERIFDPLGMKDTGFHVPKSKIHRLATSYSSWGPEGMSVYDPAEGGQWSHPPQFFSGAGGLVSTIDDYRSFARMLLQKGEFGSKRLLSPEMVTEMTKDQLTPAQKQDAALFEGFFDENGFGYGVSVVTKQFVPYRPVGQFNWDGGLGTFWIADPNRALVAILMTQQAWTTPKPPPICDAFLRAVYGL